MLQSDCFTGGYRRSKEAPVRKVLSSLALALVLTFFMAPDSSPQISGDVQNPDYSIGGGGPGGCDVPSGYTWGCGMACTYAPAGRYFCSSNGDAKPTTICMISPSPGNACFDDPNDACCSQTSGF